MSQERNEMTELDRMLAQMAQETPEMPADFHARWTEAVRAEAGQKKTGRMPHGGSVLSFLLSECRGSVSGSPLPYNPRPPRPP